MRCENPQYIAEQSLLWIRRDGRREMLQARVGVPYDSQTGHWACAAEIEGLHGRYIDIVGVSSLSAIGNAVRLIGTQIRLLVESGEFIAFPADSTNKLNVDHVKAIFGQFEPPCADTGPAPGLG